MLRASVLIDTLHDPQVQDPKILLDALQTSRLD
jgi:hypothetical protein